MLNINELIFLNQLAQGIYSLDEGRDWFNNLFQKSQLQVLRVLSNITFQAGANEKDVNKAISKSKIRSTYTPCVLLQKGILKIQLAKLLKLPPAEYDKSLCLLISLFSIADERRKKTKCKDGCSHWWHQDLSKEGIQDLLQQKKL